MYYNSITSYNNLTYSIDMISFKTYIDYDKFSNLEFYFNTFHKDKICKFWISDRINKFKYNYNLEIEEGERIFVDFHHNNEKVPDEYEGLHNLTIKFNPNKTKDNIIVQHILDLSGDWFIRSYDLAVDIKVNILDILFDKKTKRIVNTQSNGGDNISYRIGKGDKHFKIYNKKRESKLDIQGELTRIEISVFVK